MNLVPEQGDVILHYYLPSGSRLELQIYFSKNENPDLIIRNLFESESVPCSLIPDILRILLDVFNQYRRFHKVAIPKIPNFSSQKEDHPWKKYSLLFQNTETLKTLRGFELELSRITRKSIQKRKQLLICEENRFSECATNGIDTSKEHQEIIDNIELEFIKSQQKVKNDFWNYINSAKISKIIDTNYKITKKNELKEIEVSLGAQLKHKFTIFIMVSDDICVVPCIPVIETQDNEEIYLVHNENVYKRYITCLVLPCRCEGNIEILPELIRKSEESPELHFEPIREQISKKTVQKDQIFFTKHSNIEGIQGAFHVSEPSTIANLLHFANFHGIKQLVFPIYEWEHLTSIGLISTLRTALGQCTHGDLEYISFLVESIQDLNDIVNAIKLAFAETITNIIN